MTADTVGTGIPTSWLHRTLRNPRIWVLATLYAVVLATNSGYAQPPTDDALEYHRIAEAAPHLPDQPMASAFTARIAIHYLVGLVHRATGLGIESAYNVVFAVVMAMLFAVVYLLFRHLHVGDFAFASALFVFDPYTFRPYVLQVETLQDLVFVLGLGICLLGLRGRATAGVLAGLIVASLGRQTAILVAPVVSAWVLLDPRWRPQSAGRRAWPTALASLAVPFLLFMAIRVWSARFSIPYEPTGLDDTVFNLLGGLPGTAVEIAAHFARLSVPLLVPLAAFAALVVVVGRRNVPFHAWAGLALAAATVVQPALTDPRFPGFAFNEQRLAALAILPLAYAIAVLLDHTRRHGQRRWVPLLLVAILAMASLHHEFSSVGPQSLAQFLAVEVGSAITVAGLLIWDRRPRDASRDALPNALGCAKGVS